MPKNLAKDLVWLGLCGAAMLIPTELTVEGQQVSLFWPASGIAFAIALRRSPWAMIGVFALNFARLYFITHDAAASGIAAMGLVLEALVGAWLFQRVLHGESRLRRRSDLFKFMLAATLAAPVVAATVGTAAWSTFAITAWDRAHTTWLSWWYGENVGILFVGPLFLGGYAPLFRAVRKRPTESAAIALGTVLVCTAVFYASPGVTTMLRAPFAVLPLPFLYWGATRIGTAYTSLLLTLFGTILALGTSAGHGPFMHVSTPSGLVVLWSYGQLASISALMMSSMLSERDDAVSALRLSESRFRNLVEAGPSVVYAFPHDDPLDLIYISPQSADLMGYTPEECYARRGIIAELIHPEDLGTVVEQVRDAWERHERMMLEYRLMRRDGALRWVRDEATYIPERGDTPAHWQGVLVDVTEHRVVAEEHRKTQELLSGIWTSSFGAIFVLDTQGQIIMANPAAQRVMGFSIDKITGKFHNDTVWKCETEDGRPLAEDEYPFTIVMRTQLPLNGHVVAITDDSDQRRLLTLDGAPLRDGEGKLAGAFFLAEDITSARAAEERLRQSEEQLRHAQKIEAVGQLAGGVAHDFNNLLQVIQGYTRLAMHEDVPADKRNQHLDNVCDATEKAAALTSQLLAFGRRQSLEKSDCDLNLLVLDHLKMVRRLIGEHIQVDIVPGHQLGNVRVDRSQIEQVILNLCLNARDAMPNGGRLMIELGNVLIDEAYRQAHAWARPGRYAQLTVADTGMGMDPETQSRIFEPFFTTKPQGQGTGLGLSVVLGIVHQHEGLIHVYSEPERGTTFKIYIPVVERRAVAVGVTTKVSTPRGGGTVLLAEDDPNVREIAVKLLERAGYDVLATVNGEEAVALFRRKAGEVRLLMLDVVMPRMGGFEAYSEMARIRADVPVLFCSGYSGNSLSNGGELPVGTHFLHKPYSYEQLLQKTSEALQATSGAATG